MSTNAMSTSHALVCVNGECDQQTLQQIPLDSYDMLVAVDGGLRHLDALGKSADWLIGDFDSVDEQVKAKHMGLAAQVLQHPREKDATDLELALSQISTLGVTRITLLGIGGGRMDHTLANLLLLGNHSWPFAIQFYTSSEKGYLVTDRHAFCHALAIETELSLLPLNATVTGVCCTGLYYPLENATIKLGSTLGISNVVVEPAVTVTVQSGSLLLLHNTPGIFAGP